MTLQDQMVADATGVFLNTDDFAVAVTYQPGGSTSAFACSLVLADVAEQIVGVPSGNAEQRRVEAHGALAVLRAGIAAIEIATGARDPDRGDQVIVASGAYAGTWTLEAPGAPDIGGMVKLMLRRDTRYDAAAPGASAVTG